MDTTEMRPLNKFRALLESKGIYDQAMRLLREHKRLAEAEKPKAEKSDKPKPKKLMRRRNDDDDSPRDHPKDQMDYPWNEPGAPFRNSDY